MKKLTMLVALTMVVGVAAQAQDASSVPGTPLQGTPQDGYASARSLELYREGNARMLMNDFGQLERYAKDDASVGQPAPGEKRVIFFGDSITDIWKLDESFPGKHYLNRGIGGQTTPQMLVRFRADVIDLHPSVLVVLAGTNDIAGNTGPMTLEMIEDNLTSMAELARANNIKVVLSSVMPVCDYIKNQTERRPPEKIIALNAWIKDYAAKNGFIYLDYYSAMLDDKNVFKKELTYDGLHPNAEGYAVMGPLAQKAINEALGK